MGPSFIRYRNIMTRLQLIFLGVLFLIAGSCKKDDPKVLATLRYEVNVDLPAGLNTLETHYLRINDFQPRLAANLAGQGIDPARVTGIQPALVQVQAIFTNTPLDFVREAKMDVIEDNSFRSLLELYWTPQVPVNTNSLFSIPGNQVNALQLWEKEKVDLALGLAFRYPSPELMTLRVQFTLEVLSE